MAADLESLCYHIPWHHLAPHLDTPLAGPTDQVVPLNAQVFGESTRQACAKPKCSPLEVNKISSDGPGRACMKTQGRQASVGMCAEIH